ncbi:unnamed protein product [Anisakis simplex]|uniref:Glyco_hydro_38C domain-containing protein n=1 Tax=Anisakis simplex TaxID=6269 RepID=A0A0M3KIY3_ANISI|nr:unnamed protein product [Anisakis simplex]
MINAATYYSHFKRETAQGQAAQQSCRWLSSLSNQRIDQAMFVDMEHDRSLLTVRFALLDGGYKPSANERYAPAKDAVRIPASAIAVRIRYTSVRRIIFDTHVKRNDEKVTRVYFQLNYPVEIRRYRHRPMAERPDLISIGNGMRQIFFPENDRDPQNKNPRNRDNFIMAINTSPFMYIEFDSSLEVCF